MTENLNLHTVTTVDTRPFRKLVMTIGELPTSFIESMTYYELLAWFTNYLETVIIPTVNNNGEAVEELQEKYVELKNDTETEISSFETEITTAFNQLKDFVDNYFDNLDVQEEINNKLDDMAEAGTLQEIITQYINTTALWMFDNVASMKLATNFVNGSFAKTLGFYGRNDKGGATYKIRTKTNDETANEITLIALADNTLIAELVLTPCMNVRQFGAKGDGIADDTASIQSAMDNSSTVLIPAGTYMVNAMANEYPNGALLANTGNRILLDNDAKLKMMTNSLRVYRIIDINNVNDVEISGGTLEGDRSTHTGSDGEWGHCIAISGTANNIYIHDIYLKDAWGDGISVGITGSAQTARVHVDNVRRNGFSIVGANKFVSTDDIIENTNGTSPQCGVDIEPDGDTWLLNNITFNNLTTRNNTSNGMMMYLHRANTEKYKIIINNLQSFGDNRGLFLDIEENTDGDIDINDLYVTNARNNGSLFIRKRGTNSTVNIYKPVIENYPVTLSNNVGIQIEGGASMANGEIYIYNPTVINPIASEGVVNNRAILCATLAGEGASYKNIQIIDPLDLDGKTIGFASENENVIIRDNFEVIKRDVDANITISGGSDMWMWNTSNSYTADHSLNLSGTALFPIDTELDFLNTGNYKMNVRAVSQYIYPFTTDANKTITLNGKGDHLRLRRISNTEWTAIISNGNITHN